MQSIFLAVFTVFIDLQPLAPLAFANGFGVVPRAADRTRQSSFFYRHDLTFFYLFSPKMSASVHVYIIMGIFFCQEFVEEQEKFLEFL